LNQLIDTTRWTVDTSGSSGDEHLALLLGHPVAVLRAGIKIDVRYSGPHSTAPTTAVPVKLGTLAHTQDGLLAYFVADDYTHVHAVDPAIGDVTPPGGTPITSPYLDLSPSFVVQPGVGVGLTLFAVPASDMHCTVGLLPQKDVGMRRDGASGVVFGHPTPARDGGRPGPSPRRAQRSRQRRAVGPGDGLELAVRDRRDPESLGDLCHGAPLATSGHGEIQSDDAGVLGAHSGAVRLDPSPHHHRTADEIARHHRGRARTRGVKGVDTARAPRGRSLGRIVLARRTARGDLRL
jgi:hypothetical protein